MSLYHELPKTSINTILRQRFSDEELELVGAQLQQLLYSCHTLTQLHSRMLQIIKNKKVEFHDAGDVVRFV
jgi:hypothetical protein